MTVPEISVDGLTVNFPTGWVAGKFDEWAFYRENFQRVREGMKAVDVIAICPNRIVYLIEFKDYRQRKREDSETIEAVFIGKTLSTLSALLPARCNARTAAESELATQALRATKIKLVLHLDQTKPGSRQFPPVANAAHLTQKLRNKLKSIDPHLKVCSSEAMGGILWTVT